MMMKKVSLVLLITCLLSQTINSQTTIKTVAALKKKSNYNFSHEWQYLSTDLYLLNAQKFSDLLNEVARGNKGKKKRKKRNKESIQSLFVKATVKNLKFFGGDVTYPVYNFQVSEDDDLVTMEVGNIEVVRLIDNLPLNDKNEVIDAEITGEAITQKNSNDFLKLIASQLQNMSENSKPNMAVLDLVGELGKYIESKTKGKQYKFSSTIRLYDGQEFDKRLHSVNVFVFAPSSLNNINIMANKLKNYLDSAQLPVIDQAKLKKLILYKKFPMAVIANYKSRYNSQLVIGDQINFEYLNGRKLKIENAYKNELINKTTYNQELKLIRFLEIFADLKLNISNYKLNLKNNITNDYSKNLFLILKIYRDLLKTKQLRMVRFHGNSEFKNEFLPKYESVITTAGLYLNEKNSLTNVKEVAELIEFGQSKKGSWNAEVEENKLRLLYSIKIPETEKNSEQASELKRLISTTEQSLFNNVYLPIINKINVLAIDEEGLKNKEKIENSSSNTYCKKCKDKLSGALNSYTKRYQNNEKNKLALKNDGIKQRSVTLLFDVLAKKKCIEEQLNTEKDSTSALKGLIETELYKLNQLIIETREALKTNTTSYSASQLGLQNQMLEGNMKKLESGFGNLCKNMKNNCNCSEEGAK